MADPSERSAGSALAERAGRHVLRASYDSPIPRRDDLPDDIHERTSPMRGDPGARDGVFHLDNQTYDRVDAALLYGGGHAIALEDPQRLAALIPSFRPGVSPGAFWIRRRDPGSGPA